MKVNYQILLKALQMLLLPTVLVSGFLFFILLDIKSLFDLILGDSITSKVLRGCLVVAEVTLVYIVYHIKLEEFRVEKSIKDPEGFTIPYCYNSYNQKEELIKQMERASSLMKNRHRINVKKVKDNLILIKVTEDKEHSI